MILTLFFTGMASIFFAERFFADSTLHLPLIAVGIALSCAGLVFRQRSTRTANSSLKEAYNLSITLMVVSMSAVGLYWLTTDGVLTPLQLDDSLASDIDVVSSVIVPIIWLLGAIPMILVERVIAQHPKLIPKGADQHANRSGLKLALVIALIFPINYLANHHQFEWDTAIFSISRPGSSTVAVVQSLTEPVEAYLFYAPGNSVKEEMLPYFTHLESSSNGLFKLNIVDQPLVPTLAEEFNIRENGHIVFKMGTKTQKFRIQENIDRAKRDLKRLDQTVQKHLLKLTRPELVAYFLVGHGEASTKSRDSNLYKLGKYKKILQDQNYKVKEFGLSEGSTDAVPEDASFLVIAAPKEPLLVEEERTVIEYIKSGGSVMVMVEPKRQKLDAILAELGVSAGDHILANANSHIRQSRSANDRVLLFSNRFGSHASVSTLSKNSGQLAVILPTAVSIRARDDFSGKTKEVIRSFPDTFEDRNDDRKMGPGESAEQHTFAMASTGADPEKGGHRAIIIGDASVFSDASFSLSPGNQQFGLDTARWLSGDEELVGNVDTQEDVKISHTKKDDIAWFYGTIFFMPLLILLGGTLLVRRHRRTR